VQKLTGSDLEAQANALKTAKELTVQGTGEPLPKLDPADDIPFARPEYRPLFFERQRWRF
jgi:hypothetical protein